MASSFFALFDDIASLLDDVAAMTKMATAKTAGVIGDDFAVTAEGLTGLAARRELPVIGMVALGSLANKAVLIPAALALSVYAPHIIPVVLVLGGIFLCFEGAEKILHNKSKGHDKDHMPAPGEAPAPINAEQWEADLKAYEKTKIMGAIGTDAVLSAEIIAIALDTVTHAPFPQQALTLVGVGLVMVTVVYGTVALLVKADDAALKLKTLDNNPFAHRLGDGILFVVPYILRALSYIGTAAMFFVGGGMLAHKVPFLHDLAHSLHADHGFLNFIYGGVAGVIAGFIAVGVFTLVKRALRKKQP